MDEAVILSAARTPIGKYGKALSSIKATDLGAIAVKEAVSRAGIQPTDVEDCIMGNVISAGHTANGAMYATVFMFVLSTPRILP